MSSGQQQDHDLDGADPWNACPAGELAKMVERLDASQRWERRKQVYRTAVLSTGLFACVVFAVGGLMGPDRTLYGGIACSTCRNHFDAYRSHIAAEQLITDADFLASMATHLEKCSFCREKFNAMYPDQRLASTDRASTDRASTVRANTARDPRAARRVDSRVIPLATLMHPQPM